MHGWEALPLSEVLPISNASQGDSFLTNQNAAEAGGLKLLQLSLYALCL